MKKLILPLFILLVLVQWWLPAQIIWKKEKILASGKEFKFETEPVDPAHPFKGRYIILDYVADTFIYTGKVDFDFLENLYIEIGENAAGFAEIRNISREKPTNTSHYIVGTLRSISGIDGTHQTEITVEFPFTEYYLDEYKAPTIEREYQAVGRDSSHTTYAIVQIGNGEAVIKDLIINKRSARTYFDKP